MTFPPWVQFVMSGVLGVSVTLNIALAMRAHALISLRSEIETQRVTDRHLMRNWLGALALQIGQQRLAWNEFINRKYPGDAMRLTIPQPPPFDE